MRILLTISLLVLGVGFAATADADVWRWIDANGKTHFVDTMKPIYTWIDEFDKVHYGDTPDHEDAVAVQLVWVSSESLMANNEEAESAPGGESDSGETDEQSAARLADDSYYCERATEALDAYLNAPQLYRTNEGGEREILSEAETAATIAETKKKKAEYCH